MYKSYKFQCICTYKQNKGMRTYQIKHLLLSFKIVIVLKNNPKIKKSIFFNNRDNQNHLIKTYLNHA